MTSVIKSILPKLVNEPEISKIIFETLWVESNTHMTLKSVSCLCHVLHLFLFFALKDQNSNLKSGLFIGIYLTGEINY
jgi:hypothetical protein